MRYKALFLDVDGTLLTHGQKQLSKKVVAAINSIKNTVHVCLATGRILSMLDDIFQDLNLTGLCVISNGIQIYDPVQKQIVWDKQLEPRDIPVVLIILKKYNIEVRQFDGQDEFPYENNNKPIYSLWSDKVDPLIIEKIK